MVNQAQSMSDIVAKYENSALNKTDFEVTAAKIKLFEKKKILYRMVVDEVHNYDKKIVKRNKKMITNNKYILFNSWYTKNRKNQWLSSHDMWNYLKNHSSCKTFIDIFDYMEKLGKSIKIERNGENQSDVSGDEPVNVKNKKRTDLDLDNIKESNDKRLKMYEEFYKVLTATFKTNSSPAASFIYDSKFTRAFIESGVGAFKILTNKLDQQGENGTPVCEKSKKRKLPLVKQRQAKMQKRNADDLTMVNDDVEDSQMSD
ncbi:39K protein [Gynaephora ruoergensis nucleopolyhedrovirus]|nr:39K protein [Gynaephora ruoergensis nucleopolyhedrovirus]